MSKSIIQVVLFTAGNNAKMYIDKIKNTDVVAVFDNDVNKLHCNFCGHIVSKPSNLYKIKFDYIVIASAFEEIKQSIIEKYPEFENKICTLEKGLRLDFVYGQYTKINNGNLNKKQYCLDNKKMVVYTGIFGHYDTLWNPLYIDENVDYICFTDDRNLTSDYWKIRYVECENSSNALNARKYKCMPHRFLAEYDISIWIDAHLQIKSSLMGYVEKNLNNAGILFFLHPERDCVYEEGAVCIVSHRENTEKLIVQMYKYCKEGYPEHNGLYCGGFIVREHNRKDIMQLMEDWYMEIIQTSARDQISLPYVLWKDEIIPDLCKDYLWDNDYFITHDHNRLV
jgi:hypothetical protein